MKKLHLYFILLIIIVLSCKKQNQAPPPASTVSGPSPTVYPCPAPVFTNVINPNGQKLVRDYLISSGGNYKHTGIYYYDAMNRIIAIKGWDTINNGGWIYGCGEQHFVYGTNGKVDKYYNYSNGNSNPTDVIEFFYNSVPQVTLEVRTYGMNYKDSTKYYYYSGRIERYYSNKQDIYYVNSTNNVDSVWSNTHGHLRYTYDGKNNPLKDFYSRRLPYRTDENISITDDALWGNTAICSYTYNTLNLPLISNITFPVNGSNQITYYFYE